MSEESVQKTAEAEVAPEAQAPVEAQASVTAEVTEEVATEEATQDGKNMALLIWIGTIFFGFIPSLVLYVVKKDDAYIQDQAKEALNWSITTMIAYFVATILTVIVIGALLIPVIAICNLVFCIMGAIAGSKGSPFRVPFALRLIK